MSRLFDPLKVGAIELPNRIIVAEYYLQPADAGLILSEATSVSPKNEGGVNPWMTRNHLSRTEILQ